MISLEGPRNRTQVTNVQPELRPTHFPDFFPSWKRCICFQSWPRLSLARVSQSNSSRSEALKLPTLQRLQQKALGHLSHWRPLFTQASFRQTGVLTDPLVFTSVLCQSRSTSIKTHPPNPSPLPSALSVSGNPTMLLPSVKALCCCPAALRMKPDHAMASEPLQGGPCPWLQLHSVPLDNSPFSPRGLL